MFIDDFWSHVDQSGGHLACWPWLASTNKAGRGRITVDGRLVYAYRVAWELENGKPFPEGMFGCHSCDNPTCCNPGHIIPGTQADNMRQAAERKRTRNSPQYGLANNFASVTGASILEAVQTYKRGGVSQKEMAQRLGVSQGTFGRWARAMQRPDSGVVAFFAGRGRAVGTSLRPCGTYSAHARHIKAGEIPCDACSQASRLYERERRDRRRLRDRASLAVASESKSILGQR